MKEYKTVSIYASGENHLDDQLNSYAKHGYQIKDILSRGENKEYGNFIYLLERDIFTYIATFYKKDWANCTKEYCGATEEFIRDIIKIDIDPMVKGSELINLIKLK